MNEVEEQIHEAEDRVVEITAAEQKGERRNGESLTDLWDNSKCTNIHFTEEKREGTRENI